MFSTSDFYAAVANNEAETTYSIQSGGTRVTDSERINEHEGSLGNVDMQAFCGGRVTHGAGDDLTIFWQGSSTRTRTCKERTVVALREVVVVGGGIVILRRRREEN